MSSPTVSIGFPVYNGETSLRRSLDSILAQDFEDFELVISDNASIDATGSICEAYARRDRRIRYFRNDRNCGVSSNHDRVFELSLGRYFMWTAHDVELLPGMLSRCVEVMRQAPPTVVLAYPRCEMIQDGQIVPYDQQSSIASRDPRPHRRLARVIGRVVMVNQLYGLMKSEAVRKTQLNGPYPSSDYVLLAELAMLGELWEIPHTLVRRRIDADRGTAAVIHDPAAWQAWLNGRKEHGLRARLPYRERLAIEYLRAAWRLPLQPVDKLRCLMWILPVHYDRRSRSVRRLMNMARWWRNRSNVGRRVPHAQSPLIRQGDPGQARSRPGGR